MLADTGDLKCPSSPTCSSSCSSTAAQREDGSLLPPPEHVGHQAARNRKAIPVLLKRALIEEIAVTDASRVWREDGDARIGLAITAAGQRQHRSGRR